MTSFDTFATEKSIVRTSYQFVIYYVSLKNITVLICFASYLKAYSSEIFFFIIIQ